MCNTIGTKEMDEFLFMIHVMNETDSEPEDEELEDEEYESEND